jgi:long-chain fatty acid transport protein
MRKYLAIVPCLLAGLLHAGVAAASGFGLFQHGGRATGQVGAFTARGSEPSAVTYNPAAITQLEGWQVQAGLDFSNSKADYRSSTGKFVSKHIIDFPPAVYVTWRSKESPLALGLGLDAPYWYKVNWFPALFPNRFLERQLELTVLELHPVVAWDLGEGWSVGAGLRYADGSFKQGDNASLTVLTGPSPDATTNVEFQRDADADVNGTSWDVAVHYGDPDWGWGAVLRGPMRLKGNGHVTYTFRDVPSAEVQAALEGHLPPGSSRQSFEIPAELRSGIWVAPYPELRIEFDVAWQKWSDIDHTSLTTEGIGTTTTVRDWKDTYNLRLGLEGDVTDEIAVYGGVAREGSPVPGRTLQPDFPRGDATVYALGASYSFPQISFDLAFSYHDHSSNRTGIPEPGTGVRGSYSANDRVWSFSARRRF